ncbi:DUF6861 domain-containing protein [Geothermobacter hydrogeniphilus]|uniref:DUF6861 domain-containing protein n=1 Tax=Geothermobacter hydrogeniphilus TaxID=1969733 RepID=UPI0011AF7D07|nr:hypothetical protein [Geothermobacter hydrogeniphilus]
MLDSIGLYWWDKLGKIITKPYIKNAVSKIISDPAGQRIISTAINSALWGSVTGAYAGGTVGTTFFGVGVVPGIVIGTIIGATVGFTTGLLYAVIQEALGVPEMIEDVKR